MPSTLAERRQFYAETLAWLQQETEQAVSRQETPPYNLRTHQQDALAAKLAHYGDNEQTRGYINGPAGCGKTRMMLADLDAIAAREADMEPPPDKPFRSFIIVPTVDLLFQTEDRITGKREDTDTVPPREDWPFQHIQYGRCYADEKDLDQPVTLITYHSFVDMVNQGQIKPEDVDMLVFDEAHRGLSEMRQDSTREFFETSLITGYTATPEFHEQRRAADLFGEEIWSTSTKKLIQSGDLAPVRNVVRYVEMPQEAPTREEYRQAAMQHAVDLYLNYERPASEAIRAERVVGKRGILNCNDLSHAHETAEYFNKALREAYAQPDSALKKALDARGMALPDTPVEVISGTQDPTARKKVIDNLRNGHSLFAAGVHLTTEALDINQAELVMNLSETTSLVRAGQRGGRGSRPWKDKQEAYPHEPPKVNHVFDIICEGRRQHPILYNDALEIMFTGVINDAPTRRRLLIENVIAELGDESPDGKRLQILLDATLEKGELADWFDRDLMNAVSDVIERADNPALHALLDAELAAMQAEQAGYVEQLQENGAPHESVLRQLEGLDYQVYDDEAGVERVIMDRLMAPVARDPDFLPRKDIIPQFNISNKSRRFREMYDEIRQDYLHQLTEGVSPENGIDCRLSTGDTILVKVQRNEEGSAFLAVHRDTIDVIDNYLDLAPLLPEDLDASGDNRWKTYHYAYQALKRGRVPGRDPLAIAFEEIDNVLDSIAERQPDGRKGLKGEVIIEWRGHPVRAGIFRDSEHNRRERRYIHEDSLFTVIAEEMAKLPDKREEELGVVEFSKYLNTSVNTPAYRKAFDEIKTQFDALEDPRAPYDYMEDLDRFFALRQKAEEEGLTQTEITAYQTVSETIQTAVEDGELVTLEDGLPIRCGYRLVDRGAAGEGTHFHLHTGDSERFMQQAGLAPWRVPEGWVRDTGIKEIIKEKNQETPTQRRFQHFWNDTHNAYADLTNDGLHPENLQNNPIRIGHLQWGRIFPGGQDR